MMIALGLSGPRPDSSAQIAGSGLPCLPLSHFSAACSNRTFQPSLLPLPSLHRLGAPALPSCSLLSSHTLCVPVSSQPRTSSPIPVHCILPTSRVNLGATSLKKPSPAVLVGTRHTLPAAGLRQLPLHQPPSPAPTPAAHPKDFSLTGNLGRRFTPLPTTDVGVPERRERGLAPVFVPTA